jgi:valyl-tRNA synthetase
LWNIARFIEAKGEPSTLTEAVRSYDEAKVISTVTTGRNHARKEESLASTANTSADHWILRQLDTARQQLDKHIKNYRFAEAVDTVYHTVWDDVADWFIEASKTDTRPEFLRYVLDITLQLAHPFAPFVTETIWTTLRDDDSLLISQSWPKKLSYDKKKAGEFDQVKDLISNIRLVTTQLPPGKYNLLYRDDTLITENADLIKSLAKLKSVVWAEQGRGLRLATSSHEAWLDISDELVYEHQARLEAHLLETRQEIAMLESRLANPNYTAKAPAHLVEETSLTLEEKRSLETRLMTELGITKK